MGEAGAHSMEDMSRAINRLVRKVIFCSILRLERLCLIHQDPAGHVQVASFLYSSYTM